MALTTLSVHGQPQVVKATLVSPDYFAVLGVAPALGRGLAVGPGAPSAEVVLSYALWQGRFAGEPGILGRAVRLGGRPFVVVGSCRPDSARPAERSSGPP